MSVRNIVITNLSFVFITFFKVNLQLKKKIKKLNKVRSLKQKTRNYILNNN